MKTYEISYILNPELSQEDAVLFAGKITQAVEKSGGGVTYVDEPKKRKLAYFVKKYGQAYFGYTSFNLKTDTVTGLKRILDEESKILRYLIVEALKVNKNLREVSLSHQFAGRAERTAAARQVKAQPLKKPAEAKSEMSTEEIDKKLEEILK